jgi:hypothetical protein
VMPTRVLVSSIVERSKAPFRFRTDTRPSISIAN